MTVIIILLQIKSKIKKMVIKYRQQICCTFTIDMLHHDE